MPAWLIGAHVAIRRLFALHCRVLFCIAVAIDWGMMLVCMTFNAGLFCTVVGGVAAGQLLNEQGAPRGGDCCSGTAHS